MKTFIVLKCTKLKISKLFKEEEIKFIASMMSWQLKLLYIDTSYTIFIYQVTSDIRNPFGFEFYEHLAIDKCCSKSFQFE